MGVRGRKNKGNEVTKKNRRSMRSTKHAQGAGKRGRQSKSRVPGCRKPGGASTVDPGRKKKCNMTLVLRTSVKPGRGIANCRHGGARERRHKTALIKKTAESCRSPASYRRNKGFNGTTAGRTDDRLEEKKSDRGEPSREVEGGAEE